MLAHAYTAEAISRAVSCGVYAIEYANPIDANAARPITDKGAYVVLTLITYDALERLGGELGMTGTILDKLATVRDSVSDSLLFATMPRSKWASALISWRRATTISHANS